MRTTVDIPEDVLRRAKAEAAMRGMKLKDYVTEALRAALAGGLVREEAPEYETRDDCTVISDDLVLPLIRGAGGPAIRDLTNQKIHEIFEEEDLERAGYKKKDSG